MDEKKLKIVKEKCNKALTEIEKELKSGGKEIIYLGYDLSLPKLALLNIERELKMMLKILDKNKYVPSYTRFLLDFPTTPLIELLFETACIYKRYT